MLEITVRENVVRAVEGGREVGSLGFTVAEHRMTLSGLANGGDKWVADGLIRTALNWGGSHGVTGAAFAPDIDRALLRELYAGAAENGIEDISFFFATCKICGNIHG